MEEQPYEMKHLETAKIIWQTLVPKSGQADTVQGELLRAVEKLRDEAQRNGNINYDKSHLILANFLRNTLISSGIFNAGEIEKIESESEKLMHEEYPYTEDDVYDYLGDKVCEFYLAKPTLVKHENNPELWC